MKSILSLFVLVSAVSCIAIPRLNAQNVFPLPSGSVGIGTTTPQALLDVEGEALFLSGLHKFYIKSGYSFDASKAGFRVNTGSLVMNAKDGGTLYLNRDVGADTRIQSAVGAVSNDIAVFKSNGNVGIGVSEPTSKLQVNGNAYIGGGLILDPTPGSATGWFRGAPNANSNVIIQGAQGNYTAFWLTGGPDVLKLGGSGGTEPSQGAINISYTGNVGIGTTSFNDATYKLYVETGIRTRKIKVDISGWSDYVFNNDYTLRPLSQVEKFIKQYRHLPDVPSAAEVKKEGIDVGENQAVLLKKIEELTLYIIEQQKQMDELRQQVQGIQKTIKNIAK
jgi:hypothetical protein